MSDTAIYMLNALWFKKDGGQERYRKYLAATAEVMKQLEIGAEVVHSYVPQEILIGDWDPDLVFVVRYPDRAAFNRLVTSEEYGRIRHLREEAIDKSVLVQCNKGPMG